MTHYDADYSNFTDESEKAKKAMKDIVDYLGDKKYKDINRHLVLLFKSAPFNRDWLAEGLSLAGIQGYPVTAWFNQIEQEAKS